MNKVVAFPEWIIKNNNAMLLCESHILHGVFSSIMFTLF